MKNKKGFTLVELLAVIVILSAILVIIVPTILNSKDSVLNRLSDEQIRGLKNAAEMLGLDLDDHYSNIYNCKSDSWIKELNVCKMENGHWTKIENISIDDLKKYGYFEDKQNHCSGNVTITRGTNNYEVDTDTVDCSGK